MHPKIYRHAAWSAIENHLQDILSNAGPRVFVTRKIHRHSVRWTVWWTHDASPFRHHHRIIPAWATIDATETNMHWWVSTSQTPITAQWKWQDNVWQSTDNVSWTSWSETMHQALDDWIQRVPPPLPHHRIFQWHRTDTAAITLNAVFWPFAILSPSWTATTITAPTLLWTLGGLVFPGFFLYRMGIHLLEAEDWTTHSRLFPVSPSSSEQESATLLLDRIALWNNTTGHPNAHDTFDELIHTWFHRLPSDISTYLHLAHPNSFTWKISWKYTFPHPVVSRALPTVIITLVNNQLTWTFYSCIPSYDQPTIYLVTPSQQKYEPWLWSGTQWFQNHQPITPESLMPLGQHLMKWPHFYRPDQAVRHQRHWRIIKAGLSIIAPPITMALIAIGLFPVIAWIHPAINHGYNFDWTIIISALIGFYLAMRPYDNT